MLGSRARLHLSDCLQCGFFSTFNCGESLLPVSRSLSGLLMSMGVFSQLTEGPSTPLSSSDILKSTCSLLTALPSLISLVGVCPTLGAGTRPEIVCTVLCFVLKNCNSASLCSYSSADVSQGRALASEICHSRLNGPLSHLCFQRRSFPVDSLHSARSLQSVLQRYQFQSVTTTAWTLWLRKERRWRSGLLKEGCRWSSPSAGPQGTPITFLSHPIW